MIPNKPLIIMEESAVMRKKKKERGCGKKGER
jgi:hypothetical protein